MVDESPAASGRVMLHTAAAVAAVAAVAALAISAQGLMTSHEEQIGPARWPLQMMQMMQIPPRPGHDGRGRRQVQSGVETGTGSQDPQHRILHPEPKQHAARDGNESRAWSRQRWGQTGMACCRCRCRVGRACRASLVGLCNSPRFFARQARRCRSRPEAALSTVLRETIAIHLPWSCAQRLQGKACSTRLQPAALRFASPAPSQRFLPWR
jgi:hypothetical protein